MATSAQIIAAQSDEDLRRRFVALAAAEGVDSPEHAVASNMHALVAAKITAGSDTVASVYDYAAATYVPAPRPGVNPAAVTDAQIIAAIALILPVTP